MSTHTPAPPRARTPWRALAALAVLALLLHAALLAGVSVGSREQAAAAPAAMQVRTLPAPVPVPAETAAAPEPAPRLVAAAAPAAPPPRRIAKAVPAAPAKPSAAEPAPVEAAVAEPPAAAASAASAVVASEPAASAASAVADAAAPARTAGDDEVPVYKTLIPPPLTAVYDLARGMLGGTGTLVWRPDGDHYELKLEGRVAGLSVLTQSSSGGFDEAGLAPLRFTDQRMGREVRAANFQREHGKISFSGPQNEFTLLVGTQDRLSWMIQLAAVVSAEPRRLVPGGKVALYVVGARVDASMWVFRYAGEESVDTPRGPVAAVKFSREARGPYDTQADAWLDLSRHGLPVRARLGTGGDGDALDLVLREFQSP